MHQLDWSFVPAMRPITPDVLMMSPTCIFSVAMIHLFRLPPATSAMSADLRARLWSSGSSVCMLSKGPCGKMLTCTGRIALRPPSPQRAGPLCQPHSAVVESLSYGIFVCGLRRCHVSEPFLCCRKQVKQLFLVRLNYFWMTLVYITWSNRCSM